MSDLLRKLAYLETTKNAITDSIKTKGVSVPNGTPFKDYPSLIESIKGDEDALEQLNKEIERLEGLLASEEANKIRLIYTLNSKFGLGLQPNSSWDVIIDRVKGIVVYKLFCNAHIQSKVTFNGFNITTKSSTVKHRLVNNRKDYKLAVKVELKDFNGGVVKC